MPLYLDSQLQTVTSSAQAFGTEIRPRSSYVLNANVDLWFKIGADPEVAVAGSTFVKAGDARIIKHSLASQTLRIIKDAGQSDGRASLSRVQLP